MIIRINEYNLGKRIAVLALSEDAYKLLVNDTYEIMYVKEDKLYFYPDNITINLSDNEVEKFFECDSFDVFVIYENGDAFKYYDNESQDNALMLTSHCNSNCVMCPATDGLRRKESAVTPEEIIKIIHYLPTDAKHITITGGEPFLVGDKIFDVFHAAKEKLPNTQFQLLTNGRALAYKPFVERFVENMPSNMTVCIPLHGYNEKTHDAITRAKGSFEQTKLGIKNLLKQNVNIELRIVVSKLNMDFITEIAELIIKEFGSVSTVKIIGLEMLGNAAKNVNDVWIPYNLAFEASKRAIELLIENSIDVGIYNFPLCSIDKKYRYIANKSITDYKVRYISECEKCRIKDACGGVFSGTIRLAAKDIIPVQQI